MSSSDRVALSFQDELISLFDVLVDVMFCVKLRDGTYHRVNDAFVRRSGRASVGEVVGHRASEIFIPELAERYEEQDTHVFETGESLRDELELIRRPTGELGWYLTTKLPIVDGDVVVALASVSRDLKTPTSERISVESLQQVVGHVRDHLAEPIRVGDLAEIGDCSPDQLDRRMKRVFGLTPKQYVLRVRVERVTQLLSETDMALADIAASTGFYDQSDMTRRFARLTNHTPAQFRSLARDTRVGGST